VNPLVYALAASDFFKKYRTCPLLQPSRTRLWSIDLFRVELGQGRIEHLLGRFAFGCNLRDVTDKPEFLKRSGYRGRKIRHAVAQAEVKALWAVADS